jgi:Ca-activated chloride channel family protein
MGAAAILAATLSLSAQSPSVAIVSPRDGEYVSGPTVLRARVEPATRHPARVTFFANGRHVCTIERPPFECPWDAGPTVDEHEVRAVAWLEDGSRLSASVRTRGAAYAEAVDVDIVQVPVVVTDGGRFVKGLTRQAFVVREDGARQDVTYFAAADSPIEIVVAVDVSGSMTDALPAVKEAVKRFLRAMRPDDAVTVLGFNDAVFTLARRATDMAERLAAIDELSAWGGTALYDAAARAVGLLGRRPGRKALVMFTDGDDRVSRLTREEVQARLEAANVVFYAIAQGAATASPELRRALGRFAEVTGGRAFFERDDRQLDRAFGQIIDELSHHYLLGYAPSRTARDGAWRRIDVALVQGRHRVRAREGYRAVPASGDRP